jgi:mannosyltransferase
MIPRFLRPGRRRYPRWLLPAIAIPLFLEILLHQRGYQVQSPTVSLDEPFAEGCDLDQPRENAALVMLARNSERRQAKNTIASIHRRFNQWYEYPIVFLNDEEWDPRFVRELNQTAHGKGVFEVIPKEMWTYPDWVDQDVARQSIKAQGAAGIVHAGQEGYHHMCRFYSG